MACMTTPGGLTGAPRRLLTLASVLKRQEIEVCIASQSGSELLHAAGAEGHETAAMDAVGLLALRHGAVFGGGLWFRSKLAIDLLRQNLRLMCCIRQRQGHAVWIRGSKGIAFGAIGTLVSGRPLIWDVDYEPPSRGVVRWLHRLGLWASRAVVFQYAAAPDAIFGPELAARYRHKFRAIIPGIDLEALRPLRVVRERRRRSIDEPFVILQVGSICDRKNQWVLIEAVRRLRQTRPDPAFEVWFAGGVFEVEYEEALRREIEVQGLQDVVTFLGWRSDVHELMAAADLLAMPSKDEGVPNTVQEAMAIGLPVAVSKAGGMPEVVVDGDTGWVVDMDRASDWATRIEWCLENADACEAIGRRGASYALRHFGTEYWGAEYGRVVMEVVRPGPERKVGPET